MLNQVLVKGTYAEIKKYLNKQVKAIYQDNEVIVYFRVLCDETNVIEVLENCSKATNVIAVDYVGDKQSPCYCCLPYDLVKDNYIITIYKVDILEESIVKQIIGMTPNGVTPIIQLNKNFSDLEKIWRLNKQYPKVRFCGGHLFCISDCNIGCCGMDILDKKGISYDTDAFYRINPCNCALNVCDFKDITGITVVRNTNVVHDIEQHKEVKENKTVLFSDLLGDLL